MRSVKIENDKIIVNGQPVRLISGAMHYFRVHQDLWLDRFEKAKAMGLNAIETYMPWNLHEPQKGRFDFKGILDFERYIRLAGEMGFMVLVRPGPYICAEWEFGGFPAWLTTVSGLKLRCFNKPYLQQVEDYYNEILPRLKKLQWNEGGPVIAIQVENEYGSFGQDKQYLQFIKDLYDKHGMKVIQFTSDGPTDLMLTGGTLPDVWKTANFGSRPNEAFAKLREYESGPVMCMEFWNGWFDHWGEEHHVRGFDDAVKSLKEMLDSGAHVNFYMFHGGTNFGFLNGANCANGEYQPTVGSYDYDAPLSEAGDPNAKFQAYREVIAEYVPGLLDIPVPAASTKKAYGKVNLTKSASLFGNLASIGNMHSVTHTATMEELGQNFGFILYSKKLAGPVADATLTLQHPRDRAVVFIDGKETAVIYRNDKKHSLELQIPPEGVLIDVLVENMGRVNYGDNIGDARKGIVDGIRINGQFQFGWDICSLPLDDLSGLKFAETPECSGPGFFKAVFSVDEPCDTFLKVPGGKKGVCWINGFNLGRYWEVGPQQTMYVPAQLLKKGDNEIIVFEQHALDEAAVEFLAEPELG